MAVTGLPSADTLIASIATLRRQLATEEAGFRNTPFTATSTDTKVTATANGMVEALTVTIQPSAFPTTFPPATLTSLAASIKDACGKVLTNANNNTKAKASADAASYALAGIPNLNQAPPPTPGFQTSDADLTAQLRAQDPIIAAKQFQGISGPVSAIVDGTLTLVSVTLVPPIPPSKPMLEENVVIAINLALAKAKHLFEDGILRRTNDGLDSSAVTFPVACLWAQGDLSIADRVKTQVQDTTAFAPVVNAGTGGTIGTNVGVSAQLGDLWSRAPVQLRNNSKVNGNLRGMARVQLDSGASVTGLKVENGALLQIPTLSSVPVTFPGNQGDRTVLPDQPGNPTNTLDLPVGSYANVTVNGRCTLVLHTGTYFFNNWTVESGATISCVSSGGLIIVHVKSNLTFRGKIVERTGPARPKLFVGVYGTGSIPIEGPFTGTVIALGSSITLASLPSQNPPIFHSGAFYAKNITVNPDVTLKHFPFQGPPTPTSA